MASEAAQDVLSLTWSYHGGSEGRDQDAYNPLARATRRLMNDGQPFERLSMSFFDARENYPRWLGVFVHSSGDRILYFPGLELPARGAESFKGAAPNSNFSSECDHLTLEKGRSTWHLTSTGRTDYINVPRTFDLGDRRVLWVGMSVAHPSVLRTVRRDTVVEAAIPASDTVRRANIFGASREDAKFNLVSLNTDGPGPRSGHFLHFTLIVGPRGFEEYTGSELALPHGSPYVQPPLPDAMRGIRLRSHRVELSSTVDIQIIASQLPGALGVPVAFTTPAAS